MIVVKCKSLTKIPEYCDDCLYMETMPCPMNGWVDLCLLANVNMTDNLDEGWIYDGNGRPKNCWLMEIEESEEQS